MRVFVAVNASREERARLGQASSVLRDAGFPVRWVPTDNVHLTLKFLGEVSEERREELAAAVDGAVAGLGTVRMTVGGFGAFPSLRRPNVIWVGIELNEQLETLQNRLESELAALGFAKETRPFRPHLTLGRTRRGASPSEFAGLDRLAQQISYRDCFEVRAVELMRSRLLPGGAVYDVIHRSELEVGEEQGHA